MLTWPTTLKPNAGGYAPFVRSLSGGQSLSGTEQIVPQFHDRWQAKFVFALNRNDRVLALRALLAALRGRANTIALPAFEHARAPWPIDSYDRTLGPAFRRTRPLDGTIYADPPGFNDTLLTVTASAGAPLNATEISITTNGEAPTPGHLFSIGARMYVCQAVEETDTDDTYDLTIWPWLRAELLFGTVINFTSPACEMRLAGDTEGAETLTGLQSGRFGIVSLSFDEAVTEPAIVTELL